jgi:hypothetical protein
MVCHCYKVNLHSVSVSSNGWWRTCILWITVLSQLSFLLQVGIQFIGNSIYASVWVAAVCLFMELLGFSTQKWITAGGFGTVLLTLAGREVPILTIVHSSLLNSSIFWILHIGWKRLTMRMLLLIELLLRFC